MAIQATHTHTSSTGETNETQFGVGDVVRVHQRIFESQAADAKSRIQIFEGMVLSIGGREMGKSVRVRKISGTTGVELMFPLFAPVIEKVEVVKKGVEGVRQAKLYFVRDKSKREIDKIYSRSNKKAVAAQAKPAKAVKTAKKASK